MPKVEILNPRDYGDLTLDAGFAGELDDGKARRPIVLKSCPS